MSKTREQAKQLLEKLFAVMAENSNASEQEMQTAMTKARALMLQYKLTEADITGRKLVVINEHTSIYYTSAHDIWINNLADIIAQNYCCKAAMGTGYSIFSGRQKKEKEVVFIGFEDDAKLAKAVLEMAVGIIKNEYKNIESRFRKLGYSYKDMTQAKNAYGIGATRGIQDALATQTKQDETFAMVLVTPPEVTEKVNSLSTARFNTATARQNARNFDEYAVKGYTDLKTFNPSTKLEG